MERLNPLRKVPIAPGTIQLTGGKNRVTLALTYLTRTDCGTLGTAHILPPATIRDGLQRFAPDCDNRVVRRASNQELLLSFSEILNSPASATI
jgi:hypothetical protein